MEILAFLAVAIAWFIGWGLCVAWLPQQIAPEERFYFAPAVGLAVCGVVGYVAVQLRVPLLATAFCVMALIGSCYLARREWTGSAGGLSGDRLARFTVVALVCLFGAQIVMSELFSRVYPGPTPIWDLFNLSGVPPPDQMFAWYQAMFLDQHRVYPRDPFYADMDLYDRPHLGGWITLFFFKLFHLPLIEYPSAEAALVSYPAGALRFYHCFWWLLNNAYLLGVATLFRRLFGERAAIFAVASTALGGFFFVCNVGSWMKFSSAYFFLLSVVLFIIGKAPVLQALLCAASYYIHGSVLPYLAGLGILQFVSLRYPVLPRLLPLRHFLLFSSVGLIVVGAWFFVVRWSGSKQPLFYYYLYDATLTAAQTRPVHELAREFYEKYSWSTLSLRPVSRMLDSIFPIAFYPFHGWFWSNTPARFSDLLSAVFSLQRFWLPAALGVVAVPVVLMGCARAFAMKHAGKVALCLYLVPSLMIALIYRIAWPFSLHIIVPYHTLVLFMWVAMLRRVPTWSVAALGAVAAEGVLCVLFTDMRFLPVSGLRLNALGWGDWLWVVAYLVLIGVIIAFTIRELRRAPTGDDGVVPPLPPISARTVFATLGKVAAGIVIIAAVFGVHALYLRQFY